MSDNTNSKKIAKNTLLLYFRMICVMLITLYTSRVVLESLGVHDFGVYQAVGGIVGLLSFINSALSTGTSRFLTYELGTGDFEKLRSTFSTLLLVHGVLALLLVAIGEPVGVWFISDYMNIPKEQVESAIWVYQLSLITGVMSITQVPYNATIIAHEQFSIYAYLSIMETVFKLAVAYAIVVLPGDKLINYAALVCLTQIIVMSSYRLYCRKNYPESEFKIKLFNRDILKSVGEFSGWSLFAATSIALLNNGTILLLNNFFSPVVVTSRAISVQVTHAVQMLIQNFQTAANPQIVKRYAAGDIQGSKDLLLKAARFSYYLMLVIALPVILLARPLLQLWLGQVPEYAVEFLQWSMVQSLFCVFDTTFYYALYTKGQLKENALISPTIGFLVVPVEYIMFVNGYSPLVVAYLLVVVYAILGLIVKPVLIHKIADYKYGEIINVFKYCIIVSIIAVPLPIFSSSYIDIMTIMGFIEICIISALSVIITAIVIGMKNDERVLLKNAIINKLSRIR